MGLSVGIATAIGSVIDRLKLLEAKADCGLLT